MIIILTLLLLVPSLIAVFLYERFKECKLAIIDRVGLLFIFSFFINMGVYSVIWVRGGEFINWAPDNFSSLASVSFCLKYMLLSLIFAGTLSYIFSLMKIGKKK